MTKKTINHASADVGLIFTAFNLRRIFNIIDKNLLKEYLKVLALILLLQKAYFKHLSATIISYSMKAKVKTTDFLMRYNRLYLTPDKLDFNLF